MGDGEALVERESIPTDGEQDGENVTRASERLIYKALSVDGGNNLMYQVIRVCRSERTRMR